MKDRLCILMVAARPFPAARGTPVRILRPAETLVGRALSRSIIAGPGPALRLTCLNMLAAVVIAVLLIFRARPHA